MLKLLKFLMTFFIVSGLSFILHPGKHRITSIYQIMQQDRLYLFMDKLFKSINLCSRSSENMRKNMHFYLHPSWLSKFICKLQLSHIQLMFGIFPSMLWTEPTSTRREEEKLPQTQPEKHLTENKITTKGNQKEDETFSTRSVLQTAQNEKSSPFDTADKVDEVAKSNKTNPVERTRHGTMEEERKGKNKISARTVHLTQEPVSTEALGEPRTLKQLESDTVYTKIHTMTSLLQQVTKKSDKPQLVSATTLSTKPTKTNKRRKKNKTLNSPKGKRKTTPQTYFPYFKDDYCPPECACYGR